nr:helix-turn-helix transcriptional regulator [uncultured Agathobaculum sp.]
MYCAIDIGGRIRYFRKLKGWSQETLALQADMNPAFLGHLERGLKSPTVKTLEKIAAALDISMAELFSEPQPISDEKEALLTELRDLLQGLSAESLRKITVILQNILSLER